MPAPTSTDFAGSFACLECSQELQWLQAIRQAAMERFSELGFPNSRQEEWKYTKVDFTRKKTFEAAPANPNGLTADRLAQLTFGNLDCPRLVFVNGHYSQELSSLQEVSSQIQVQSLSEVLRENPERAKPHLTQYAGYQDHAFVALNTAFIQDGAFVHIPEGKRIHQPIHLLFLSTAPGETTISHPRNLIILDDNSQATILESYVGLSPRAYFTNSVTEIAVGENANLDHYKLQRESEEAFHIATLQIHQGRSSKARAFDVTLGGVLTRNEVNGVLAGAGAECALDGLYLVSGGQHVDNHTRLEHAKPHCDSREAYKGILDGQATGVFHGRIVVQPEAQRTDSKQTNNNLLLSDDAVINTKPQLEIYADDVKCTHGATIGQLDEDALFYLRSRGIGTAMARSLLIYAFATQVTDGIRVETVRAAINDHLFSWLPQGQLIKEAV
ncbi:MAG: Fe-S cluster assembly protein SufD [Acidobacteriota bacterium]|nr:Fe-S cluster assembly protein SufD [Acidobacteriota bacterium]